MATNQKSEYFRGPSGVYYEPITDAIFIIAHRGYDCEMNRLYIVVSEYEVHNMRRLIEWEELIQLGPLEDVLD